MIIKYIAAYIATGVSFLLIDSVWLKNAYEKLYKPEIGDMLYEGGFRMGPAIAFYLLYILGIMIFAVGPALNDGKWQTALLWGALLGFFCYMTYDMTSYAVLKQWSLKVTILDMIWGTILTGGAALGGYWITTWIFGKAV
ncbi:DUF2177 family protein [Sphingorhabdus arenilitoris]|uniref:DUF2177 family protein n=1 Tax=Sphingorhabdus arenilitoris TaxID=1490041 RepID=A0ABV8RFQ4_9SPHN